jgi:hypothetical protein
MLPKHSALWSVSDRSQAAAVSSEFSGSALFRIWLLLLNLAQGPLTLRRIVFVNVIVPKRHLSRSAITLAGDPHEITA